MKFKLIVFFLSIAFHYAHSQQQFRKFNTQTFVKNNSEWKFFDNTLKREYDLADEITVKFEKVPNATLIKNIESKLGVTLVRSNKLGYYDFKLHSKSSFSPNVLNDFSKLLNTDKVYANIQGNFLTEAPNDPRYRSQWGLPKLEAEKAWEITAGANNVIVAVIDSGVDWTHEDLGIGNDDYENIYLNPGEDAWSNPNDPSSGNGKDDDGNGLIDDWKGWDYEKNNNDSRDVYKHGTHVAGIVAGKTNNGIGISGIAGGLKGEGCKIMPIQVANKAADIKVSIFDDAVIYAADNGADIIQLSLNVPASQNPAFGEALTYAYDKGVFIVCSSGNGNKATEYPASHPKVFGVGATTNRDSRASFSSYGEQLDLAAPGDGIVSTRPNNAYASDRGTSFASPMVSGVAALLLSVNKSLSNKKIADILRTSADKVGGYKYDWSSQKPGHSKELGYGRLNAFKAVKEATLSMDSKSIISFKVFPNPITNGAATIRLNKVYNKIDVVISDVLGKQVHKTSKRKTNEFDIFFKASAGIYFVSITTEGGHSETLKLIKK